MFRRFSCLLLFPLLFSLVSCNSDKSNKKNLPTEVNIETESSTTDNYKRVEITPLTEMIPLSPVDIILQETEDGRKALDFSEHGIIKGEAKIMVPVITYAKDGFSELGINVSISVDGRHVTLTKDEIVVEFEADFITAYVNNIATQLLIDMPFYNNGTLYIPFESALDMFGYKYEYEENKLIVRTVK